MLRPSMRCLGVRVAACLPSASVSLSLINPDEGSVPVYDLCGSSGRMEHNPPLIWLMPELGYVV